METLIVLCILGYVVMGVLTGAATTYSVFKTTYQEMLDNKYVEASEGLLAAVNRAMPSGILAAFMWPFAIPIGLAMYRMKK
jgi:ABC-type methionine transport system permease subunit